MLSPPTTSAPRREERLTQATTSVPGAIFWFLLATLVIIRDADRPFGGIIDVAPTASDEVERQVTRDFLAHHKAADLPCDADGNRWNA
ncbi:hypothetical protein ABZX98_17895 [Streptomyces sp. NPDC002992]|uniref:hypothetical protein n=1 Tax=Streptomyces sp. NPDC002992 TaxID=3154273 RepID=UPI0033B84C16